MFVGTCDTNKAQLGVDVCVPSEARRDIRRLIYSTLHRLTAPRATGRLITDWVSLGLLDKPVPRSRGRGKGVERTWSENQLQLFVVLLDKRREVRHVAALCNVPVMLWLYWGTDYVPVRQVRKALRTFNRPLLATSARAARQNARRVIAQLGAPNMKRQDKTDLTNAIVTATGGGRFPPRCTTRPARRI